MDHSKPVKRLPLILPPPLPKSASSVKKDAAASTKSALESKDNPAGQVTGMAPNPKLSAAESISNNNSSNTTRLAGKERVFYSDFIRPSPKPPVDQQQPVKVVEPVEEAPGGVQVVTIGSPNLRDLIKRRKLPAITSPKSNNTIEPVTKSESKTNETASYISTVNEPKVIISHESRMGLTPRKLAIERKKRIFSEQHIHQLLASHGITDRDYEMIEPSGGAGGSLSLVEVQQSRAKSFLPLHLFDNTDWDERPAIEWLSFNPHEKFVHHQSRMTMAKVPVPAIALIPGQSGLPVWESVMVTAYDFSKELWKIVPDPTIAATVAATSSKSTGPSSKPTPVTSAAVPWTEYWVHKINLMFKSEDPFKFAKRVAEAHSRRRQVEDNIRFQFYVDGMPTMGPGGLELSDATAKRIIQLSVTKNVQKSKGFMQSAWVQNSIRDIKNDYSRTMNAIALEVTVRPNGTLFSLLNLEIFNA